MAGGISSGTERAEAEGSTLLVRTASYQPTREEIGAEVNALSRDLFRRVLVDYIGYAPSPVAIKKLAEKSPDRWIQGLTMLAQLAGYKKDVVEVNNIVMVGSLSDAEMLRRMRELEAKLGQARQMIEVKPQTDDERKYVLAPSRDDNIVDIEAKEKK